MRREQMYQEQQQKHAQQVAEARAAVAALQQQQKQQQQQQASVSAPSPYQASTNCIACWARSQHLSFPCMSCKLAFAFCLPVIHHHGKGSMKSAKLKHGWELGSTSAVPKTWHSFFLIGQEAIFILRSRKDSNRPLN